LEAVLNDLGKLNPKLIKQIAEFLSNNPHDKRSIGEIIVSNSKTFAICKVARFNKLI
jgi:hypothetical protein